LLKKFIISLQNFHFIRTILTKIWSYLKRWPIYRKTSGMRTIYIWFYSSHRIRMDRTSMRNSQSISDIRLSTTTFLCHSQILPLTNWFTCFIASKKVKYSSNFSKIVSLALRTRINSILTSRYSFIYVNNDCSHLINSKSIW